MFGAWMLAAPARAAESGDASTSNSLDELGDYERQAVRRVLEARGYEVVDDPEGRRVGEVRVVTLPVFSERDGDVLEWFNRLHWTSRPEVIRRDVVLRPGDTWSDDEARESERNLRDPRFLSLAVVLPIESGDSETVDLLVVTRDIWSLRSNTSFELQNTTLSDLYASITENNFLGRHKIVSAEFTMDLGSFSVGPRYFDPNLFGTHAQLSVRGGAIFGRRTGGFEGTRGQFELSYPFWRLDQTWGGSLSVVHDDRIVRRFRGPNLLPYDDPETSTREAIPQRYRQRILQIEALGTYGVGTATEHRFSLGYRYQLQKPELLPGFGGSQEVRAAFRRDVLPQSERVSAPVFRYEFFLPTWVTYRNLDTYDLPEQTRVGPYATLEAAPSFEALGASGTFLDLAGVLGWHVDIAERGFLALEADASSRLRGERSVDNLLGGRIRLATPTVGDAVRLVVRSEFEALLRDTQNRLLFTGGQRGLRGYPIGAFAGSIRSANNVELRSMPLEVWFTRVGGVVFWDAAHVAEAASDLRLRHDVGLGMRILVPQANTVPFRLDWAFPVSGDRAAWPGRVSLGFRQAF
jgi:hypothetical protein